VEQTAGTSWLASGTPLTISGKSWASGFAVSALAGLLAFSGAGARLKSLSFRKNTAISFDIGKMRAGTNTVLETATKNRQKTGPFSVTVAAHQQRGSCGITQKLVQARNTVWTIGMGSAVLGSPFLDGSAFRRRA
jgi:hypothetical protein